MEEKEKAKEKVEEKAEETAKVEEETAASAEAEREAVSGSEVNVEEKAQAEPVKEEKKGKIKAKGGSVKTEELIDQIKNMSVLELSELVKALEETFGVSAAAQMAVAAAPGAVPAEAAGAEAEEKTTFDVVLVSAGDKKIQVIKEVRTLTGLGLKEAKALVDEAPKPVKESVSKEEAEKAQSVLQEAGATVEIK